MADFKVTPGDLHDLAARLASLLGEVDQATGRLCVDRAAAAGAPPLEEAINGFISRWSGEVAHVRTQLDELAGQLADAGSGYAATENSILGTFATHR